LGHTTPPIPSITTTRWPASCRCSANKSTRFLTNDKIKGEKFHFFEKGMKRLVLELELEDLTIFLATFRSSSATALPLRDLHSLLGDVKRRSLSPAISMSVGPPRVAVVPGRHRLADRHLSNLPPSPAARRAGNWISFSAARKSR
jgi:hypothetical protein